MGSAGLPGLQVSLALKPIRDLPWVSSSEDTLPWPASLQRVALAFNCFVETYELTQSRILLGERSSWLRHSIISSSPLESTELFCIDCSQTRSYVLSKYLIILHYGPFALPHILPHEGQREAQGHTENQGRCARIDLFSLQQVTEPHPEQDLPGCLLQQRKPAGLCSDGCRQNKHCHDSCVA